MSTISFEFEDLCAFFTKDPTRLMVGMISTDNEAPENVHRPHIIIKENGVVRREYHNFSEINGDISLDVYPESKPFVHHTPRSGRDPRQSFGMAVDIQKDLYPGETLRADGKRCRARMHFNTGTLYTSAHAVNAVFADAKTKTPSLTAPSTIGTKAGLDTEIPKHGYAVLHFHGDTEDFVFKGNRNYQVEVTNRADSIDFNHFQYFYNIVTPKPKRKIIPMSAQSIGLNVRAGNWMCLIGDFSQSDYDLPSGKKR